MGIKYYVWPDDNSIPIGNMDTDCIECANTCTAQNELSTCPVTGAYRRRGLRSLEFGKFYLCTDEAVKSTRLFREKMRAFSEIIPFSRRFRDDAIRAASDDVHRLIHNLVTLNARTIQAIYRVVPQDNFSQRDRESLLRTVSRILLQSPEETTSLVISVLKNANLEKTEFSVYAKLHEQESVSLRSYPIHKVFMLVLNTYWDVLKEKEVTVRIGRCTMHVVVDYDIIAASLVHLLDNTTKYILPGSQLRISFESNSHSVNLVLDMISLRIHPDELDKIFREGFSGDEPKKIGRQGEGRGLYLVDRLLALSNSKVTIDPNVNKQLRTDRMGVVFEHNIFRLSMPKAN